MVVKQGSIAPSWMEISFTSLRAFLNSTSFSSRKDWQGSGSLALLLRSLRSLWLGNLFLKCQNNTLKFVRFKRYSSISFIIPNRRLSVRVETYRIQIYFHFSYHFKIFFQDSIWKKKQQNKTKQKTW